MRKKFFIFILMTGFGVLIGLQSCGINNNNPTVPAPIPTNTSTFTPTDTSTPTVTPTFSSTPVACNIPVVLSEATPNQFTATGPASMYADQFTLAATPGSNIEGITVNTNGTSATIAGSSSLEVGIYSDNGANYPNKILFKSAPQPVISAATTAYIFTFTPNDFSLPSGKYWLTVYSNIQYNQGQLNGSGSLNYLAPGHFPKTFPVGAISQTAPWSYSMDTCHP